MLFLWILCTWLFVGIDFLDLQIANTVLHHYITRSQASAQTAATARFAAL